MKAHFDLWLFQQLILFNNVFAFFQAEFFSLRNILEKVVCLNIFMTPQINIFLYPYVQECIYDEQSK